MFFVEAPVVSHEFRRNRPQNYTNTIIEKIVKQELGHKSYLINDKEAYIVATTYIEVAHGFLMDTTAIYNELQQVLHGVGCQYTKNTITLPSAPRYAHRVITRVNK